MRIKPIYFLAIAGLITVAGTIDLNNLDNYANQTIPNYITKDNTTNNVLTDAGATLGRVLFYDKKLSTNNTIACASCHKQEFAFSDTARASIGVNGTTGRHSMRLINTRFSDETRFFWDERATTLEQQTTMPIQDHAEMGYSGLNGDPSLNDLITKLQGVWYYKELFQFVYGDTVITEQRMQLALAQFIRSIQSFDSKFDIGRVTAPNDGVPFQNFTQQENSGKNLFLAPPQFDNQGNRVGGGAGCAGCHRPPEFDIDPLSRNNGIIGTINNTGLDLTVTRSPTLRDLMNPSGMANSPFMHIGISTNPITFINHYDSIVTPPANTNLDPRLRPGGNLQNLRLTNQEKNQLIAFIHTLTGNNVYTDPKWSNPFTNDSLTLINIPTGIVEIKPNALKVYPTITSNFINIELENSTGFETISIIDMSGKLVYQENFKSRLDVSNFSSGLYHIVIDKNRAKFIKK